MFKDIAHIMYKHNVEGIASWALSTPDPIDSTKRANPQPSTQKPKNPKNPKPKNPKTQKPNNQKMQETQEIQ